MKKLIACCVMLAGCSPGQNDKSSRETDSLAYEKPLSYQYEPAIYELNGTLKIQNFWGPPGYGEDTLTDMKEPCAILVLSRPIDMAADTAGEFNQALSNVKEIQLVSDGKLSNYDGKQITVRGELFGAQTGHHHTDVLLDVKRIKIDK